MGVLKKSLMKIFPDRFILGTYALKDMFTRRIISYSFEGEDIVLNNIFEDQKKGFYVDIGANHPNKFSNTYLFYKKGWCGINIDATPGSMMLFNIFRKRDINLEVPVSNNLHPLKYYIFDEPGINSFSEQLSVEREKTTNYKIIKTIEMKPSSIKAIMDMHLPENTVIDFMSVDVEGFDFNVLQSNDLDKYKPRVIVVEQMLDSCRSIKESEIYNFLKKLQYALVNKTGNSCFYILSTDPLIKRYCHI